MYRFLLIFGTLVLGLYTGAEYRGWSLTSYDEVKNIPKSIRDNPGAYRSVYQRFYHK
jgi:hypothetical protein